MVDVDANHRRVQRELTREQSLRLLSGVHLGRVVFTDRALPAIRPVNHVLDDDQVIIRSHSGAAILSAAQHRVVVAYEADTLDPQTRLGWSVVVTGIATQVRDPAEVARYQELLRPWVDRHMDQVIAISTDLVTGFALDPAPSNPPILD